MQDTDLREPCAYASIVGMASGAWRWDGLKRLRLELEKAECGHRPYEHLVQAHLLKKLRESEYQSAAAWTLAADINPFVQLSRMAQSTREAQRLMVSFMETGPMAFRTFIDDDGKLRRARVGNHQHPDIPAVGAATFALIGTAVVGNRNRSTERKPIQLRELLQLLNVQSPVLRDLFELLEQAPAIRTLDAAKALGCSASTLNRELKALDLSMDLLRKVAMLQAAVARFGSSESLTDIAHAIGYADLAHMSRAFRRATGSPPSVMREAVFGS
jgi:AraC-like DNA-binding protein